MVNMPVAPKPMDGKVGEFIKVDMLALDVLNILGLKKLAMFLNILKYGKSIMENDCLKIGLYTILME